MVLDSGVLLSTSTERQSRNPLSHNSQTRYNIRITNKFINRALRASPPKIFRLQMPLNAGLLRSPKFPHFFQSSKNVSIILNSACNPPEIKISISSPGKTQQVVACGAPGGCAFFLMGGIISVAFAYVIFQGVVTFVDRGITKVSSGISTGYWGVLPKSVDDVARVVFDERGITRREIADTRGKTCGYYDFRYNDRTRNAYISVIDEEYGWKVFPVVSHLSIYDRDPEIREAPLYMSLSSVFDLDYANVFYKDSDNHKHLYIKDQFYAIKSALDKSGYPYSLAITGNDYLSFIVHLKPEVCVFLPCSCIMR